MRIRLSSKTLHSVWVEKIAEISGQNLASCYQCGKCSAGCPAVSAMDILPNQVIRLVQLGLEEELMRAKTPWICASCFTCLARCPRGVDLSKVMEAIRQIVLRARVDWVKPESLSKEVLAKAPQMGIVGGFRKYTG